MGEHCLICEEMKEERDGRWPPVVLRCRDEAGEVFLVSLERCIYRPYLTQYLLNHLEGVMTMADVAREQADLETAVALVEREEWAEGDEG